MVIKYDIEIDKQVVAKELKRITNLIYKLLPYREENMDWEKPLETIFEELAGISRLIGRYQDSLFLLLSKLEGLFVLTKESDFGLFRRIIFEALSLCNKIREEIEQNE